MECPVSLSWSTVVLISRYFTRTSGDCRASRGLHWSPSQRSRFGRLLAISETQT